MKIKKWGKPKLIILIKGKPDEGVLLQCKMTWLSGYANQHQLCSYAAPDCHWCSDNQVAS